MVKARGKKKFNRENGHLRQGAGHGHLKKTRLMGQKSGGGKQKSVRLGRAGRANKGKPR